MNKPPPPGAPRAKKAGTEQPLQERFLLLQEGGAP